MLDFDTRSQPLGSCVEKIPGANQKVQELHVVITKIFGTNCQICDPQKKDSVIFFLDYKAKKTIDKTGNSRALFQNPIPVSHFRNFR